MSLRFKRVLLKLSGEAFKGERDYGIDPQFLIDVADEIKHAVSLNVQIGIVIGGRWSSRRVSKTSPGHAACIPPAFS